MIGSIYVGKLNLLSVLNKKLRIWFKSATSAVNKKRKKRNVKSLDFLYNSCRLKLLWKILCDSRLS